VLLANRERERDGCAANRPVSGSQFSAMLPDDRAANRQAHPEPFLLRREKRLKRSLRALAGESRARIGDFHLQHFVVKATRDLNLSMR
jgi:hypothetical protein